MWLRHLGQFTQFELLHLATGGAGEFVEHDESLGKLLFGQLSRSQPVDDFGQRDGLVVSSYNDSANTFDKNRIGAGDYCNLSDFGVPEKVIFDLFCADILAT